MNEGKKKPDKYKEKVKLDIPDGMSFNDVLKQIMKADPKEVDKKVKEKEKRLKDKE